MSSLMAKSSSTTNWIK